jgi:hypothetical protein
MHRITMSVSRFGDDLCEDTGLRGIVREHPLLTTTLVAAVAGGLGFLAGPKLVSAVASKWSSLTAPKPKGSARASRSDRSADEDAQDGDESKGSRVKRHAHLASIAMRAMRTVMTASRR